MYFPHVKGRQGRDTTQISGKFLGWTSHMLAFWLEHYYEVPAESPKVKGDSFK